MTSEEWINSPEHAEIMRKSIVKAMQDEMARKAGSPREWVEQQFQSHAGMQASPPVYPAIATVNATYAREVILRIMDDLVHGRYEEAMDKGEMLLSTIDQLIERSSSTVQYPAIPPNPAPGYAMPGIPTHTMPGTAMPSLGSIYGSPVVGVGRSASEVYGASHLG